MAKLFKRHLAAATPRRPTPTTGVGGSPAVIVCTAFNPATQPGLVRSPAPLTVVTASLPAVALRAAVRRSSVARVSSSLLQATSLDISWSFFFIGGSITFLEWSKRGFVEETLAAVRVLNALAKIGETNTLRKLVSLHRHDAAEVAALVSGSGIGNSNREGCSGASGQKDEALVQLHCEDL